MSTIEAKYNALMYEVKKGVSGQRLLLEIEWQEVPNPSLNLCKYDDHEIMKQWHLQNILVERPRDEVSDRTSVVWASEGPQLMFADNQGAMKLAANPHIQDHTKPIDIRYHYVWEAIGTSEVTLDYVFAAEITKDIMKKVLPQEKHWEHLPCVELGVSVETAKKYFAMSGIARGILWWVWYILFAWFLHFMMTTVARLYSWKCFLNIATIVQWLGQLPWWAEGHGFQSSLSYSFSLSLQHLLLFKSSRTI
jgi:hypothetical protein